MKLKELLIYLVTKNVNLASKKALYSKNYKVAISITKR